MSSVLRYLCSALWPRISSLFPLQVPHGILASAENPTFPKHPTLALGGGATPPVFLAVMGRLDTQLPAADGWPISEGRRDTHIKQTELMLEMLLPQRDGWLRGHWSFEKITLRAQESGSAFKGLLDH